MQLKNLHSACGGMAAYAVVFAVEVHNRGRKNVETLTITSDNCMLTSMDIEVTETGDVRPGHHVSAGIFQALAKEKGMQRCADHEICRRKLSALTLISCFSS